MAPRIRKKHTKTDWPNMFPSTNYILWTNDTTTEIGTDFFGLFTIASILLLLLPFFYLFSNLQFLPSDGDVRPILCVCVVQRWTFWICWLLLETLLSTKSTENTCRFMASFIFIVSPRLGRRRRPFGRYIVAAMAGNNVNASNSIIGTSIIHSHSNLIELPIRTGSWYNPRQRQFI